MTARRIARLDRDRLAEVNRPFPCALARAGTPTDAVDGLALRVAGEVDAATQRPRLAAALTRMAERDREVLLLVAWGGLSCEEAAEALGITAGAVKTRLHRARMALRQLLEGELVSS